MTEQTLRIFVSSPNDVAAERRRVDLVVERLNAEFAGRIRLETILWESRVYSAHDTFQKQIPEAATCDIVIAIFRARLGTPLPSTFPPLPTGEPYPSGTAYEILSAIEARKAGQPLPDIYVFRCEAAREWPPPKSSVTHCYISLNFRNMGSRSAPIGTPPQRNSCRCFNALSNFWVGSHFLADSQRWRQKRLQSGCRDERMRIGPAAAMSRFRICRRTVMRCKSKVLGSFSVRTLPRPNAGVVGAGTTNMWLR